MILLNKELVTNGSAPVDLTGWHQYPGDRWSIVNNKFRGEVYDGPNILYQDFGVIIGRKYKFSYEVTANALTEGNTSNQLLLSANSSFGAHALSSAVGIHTYYLTATIEAAVNEQLKFYIHPLATGGIIDLDNISVKEYIPAELSRTGQHFLSFSEN